SKRRKGAVPGKPLAAASCRGGGEDDEAIDVAVAPASGRRRRHRPDPLRDADLLRRAAFDRAAKLSRADRPVTAMEFCRTTIWGELGLPDFGVGSYQRIAISRARREALGDGEDGRLVAKPPAAAAVDLPSLKRCLEDTFDGKNAGGVRRRDASVEERLREDFDAAKLVRGGILHLPGVASDAECRRVLTALAASEPGKKVHLRPSTGNGANGSYAANLPRRVPLLDEIQRALSDVLRDELDVAECGIRPILLQYGNGGVNWAHQDQADFPYQALLLLSRPGVDFAGGQLYVTEPLVADADPKAMETTRAIANETNEVDSRGIGDVVVFAANGKNRDGRNWYHDMREVRPGSHGPSRCHRVAIGLLQWDGRQRRARPDMKR
ncbi:hypothetical protein ACHAWF_007765, partial [Thalassiosira exigua]